MKWKFFFIAVVLSAVACFNKTKRKPQMIEVYSQLINAGSSYEDEMTEVRFDLSIFEIGTLSAEGQNLHFVQYFPAEVIGKIPGSSNVSEWKYKVVVGRSGTGIDYFVLGILSLDETKVDKIERLPINRETSFGDQSQGACVANHPLVKTMNDGNASPIFKELESQLRRNGSITPAWAYFRDEKLGTIVTVDPGYGTTPNALFKGYDAEGNAVAIIFDFGGYLRDSDWE